MLTSRVEIISSEGRKKWQKFTLKKINVGSLLLRKGEKKVVTLKLMNISNEL